MSYDCRELKGSVDNCRKPDELVDLITKSRTVLSSFAKAKTAKLGMH